MIRSNRQAKKRFAELEIERALKLQGRVAETLGLELNERLARLMPSRTEYGYQDDICISFEISNALGGFHVARESEFAGHPGERNIGLFGAGNPVEALRLLLEAYPDATVLMRRDGKPRRTRAKKSRRTKRSK